MRLKLFLADYQYRQMLMKAYAMKITNLPVVKQLYHKYQVKQFKKENKNLDGWECYVKIKQHEADYEQFKFNLAIAELKACLQDAKASQKELEDCKEAVLAYSIIQEKRYNELNNWVENVGAGESDLSMLDNALKGLLK